MEIIDFQNKRWHVKYRVRDDGITAEALNWFKWYRGASMVLKKDGILLFVDEITDADFEEFPYKKDEKILDK